MGAFIHGSFYRCVHVRQHRFEGSRISRIGSCLARHFALSESKRRSFRVKGEVTRGLLRAALATGLLLGLSGCGQYQGWTRYECQLVENWDAKECNKPDCLVQGICTEDILGEEIYGQTGSPTVKRAA